MTRDPRRGAALFVVLLFSALLGGLAASAMRTSLSGVRAAAVFADGIRADELGRSAGDILAYRLATGDATARRGGSIAVRLPDDDVVIDYLSESARIDVNQAPTSLLGALFGAAGADPDEVRALTDRIARLRSTARGGPRTSDPRALATGGLDVLRAPLDAPAPAARSATAQPLAIRDLSEVQRAWGLGDALARQVLPVLTVSNGTAKVDPVLAGRLVVLALVGGDERADDYLRRRRQGFVDREAALELLSVPSRDIADFKDVAAVRATVRVSVARRLERRYEMVLAPAPAGRDGPRGVGTPPAQGAAAQAPPGQPAPPAATDGSAVPVVVSWRKLP